MAKPLRIGIAGLGTVGVGVIRMMRMQGEMIAARAGRSLELTAVSARSRDKDRGIDLDGVAWETDPVALAQRDDVDVFIELMGGHEGPAKDSIEAAIAAGKDVVTANKALLAHHGYELAQAAEANGVALRYEAAVAGGIPVIKSLSEGLAGNGINRIMGVMNGTCNYILTRMEATGRGYNALFEECAQLGYLEADPNLDVGGIDAAHKLAILASIAYGSKVNFDAIDIRGIQDITLEDIQLAAELGYRIKLLGVTQLTGRGLEQRMTPCLVPALSPLGQLEGGTNMVVIDGDAVGQVVLRGAGAGEGPTASAVMGDVIDVARDFRMPVFGVPAESLRDIRPAQAAIAAPYYLRFKLLDKPGALAKVASALGDSGVSISRMRQKDVSESVATVLIVTHKTTQSALDEAITDCMASGVVDGSPVALRIEEV